MARRRRLSRRRAGFTLLESLVVVALMALFAGMAAQLLRPPSGRLRLESATRALCASLRATRARAIATNAETAVVFNLARKSYTSPVGGEGKFPADAQIFLEIAHTQRLTDRLGAISFFADGTSTGGDVTLVTPQARATIGVNWLTGEATCALA